MLLPENLTPRPLRREDLPALLDLMHAIDHANGSLPWLMASHLETFFSEPNLNPEKDTFVFEQEGRMIGYGDCGFTPETGHGQSAGGVHPDFWGQGLGTRIIELTEQRIRARLDAEAAPELPVSLQRATIDQNRSALRLFDRHGYRHVRDFYTMNILLDQPIDAPPLPVGLELRPFDAERDTHAVYETHQETFQDHWNYHREPFEEWEHYLLKAEDVDTSLWLIAYEGDEIAGIALNSAFAVGSDTGWVSTLGVRRRWRKRGLGTALLRQSFARFQQRGFAKAGLGVDASSLTNAVALYEHAGMHVLRRLCAYRKMLRGEDPEATT